ncbi:glutathionylspermidine synthase family protein, putative (macronuclear) [Tetrahymena thermophila SB210]|uniref:Glutathionylspermidine synthase family protein, putative n=1 Tax=Tetrahymena thermophila (strain SB210) TaxID=312017 RepID=W7X123_TETTS|nr:glutathionylspermidine synthase family protein, putative [Tetrahymena thermophila SB210]EWS72865.1 glutathionylspermidine synthase family protein, putative [Tetrahymena thermophila SB210]|eukprot:XP_012654593.1 glutathionylspermidine synthase family protein, putative [Tetrahymena thermophila SB210]
MIQNKKNQLCMFKNQSKEDTCTFNCLKKLMIPDQNFIVLSDDIENINEVMIEPPWQIIMSNKSMSALLYQLFPENPHLIQTSLKQFFKRTPQLSKQKYAREEDYIYNSQNYSEDQF